MAHSRKIIGKNRNLRKRSRKVRQVRRRNMSGGVIGVVGEKELSEAMQRDDERLKLAQSFNPSTQIKKFTKIKEYDTRFNQLVVNYNGDDFYNSFKDDCLTLLVSIVREYENCVTIIIKVKNMKKKFDENRIKEISKYLYDNFFLINDKKYKLVIDNNMPLPDERLSIGAESDHLVLYYNPKGTSMGTFAPTGHGGINGYLFLKDRENTEFIIGTIMNRGGKKIFNAFGGSPDYEDKSHINDKTKFHELKEDYKITLHREMIEELFEIIFRYKAEISRDDNDYKIFNAIMSNLTLKDPYFKTIPNDVHDTNYEHKKLEINKQQFLNSTIFKHVKIPNEYDGLYFYHKLPTTIEVDSITKYYVNDLVAIPDYTCNEIFGSICDTYAKKELEGVFMIKRTYNYHAFVANLINHINLGTIKNAKKEIEKTEIDFINLKINGVVYNDNLKFEYEIIPSVDEKDNCNFKNNMLYIYLKNSDKCNYLNCRLCVFIKVALGCDYKLLVEKKMFKGREREPLINTNAGAELYFLLKYLNMTLDYSKKKNIPNADNLTYTGYQLSRINPELISTTSLGGTRKLTKKRRPTKRIRPTKRRRHTKKRRPTKRRR